MSYSSNIPRERERVDRMDPRVERVERDVYPPQSYQPSGYPVQYTERTVRREFHDEGGFFNFLNLHKFLISAVILGLILAASMSSRDIDSGYYGHRSLLGRTSDGIGSITDKVSDSLHYLGDKILPHKPSMTEQAYNKARYGVKDSISSISSSAAAARDKVSDSLSYIGDKIMHTADDAQDTVRGTMRDSKGVLRRAKDKVYELGRDVSDKAYDAKDTLMDRMPRRRDVDVDDYEYVRRPRRSFRRHREWEDTRSSWSIGDMISQHPWLSTALGLLLFLSLRNLFTSNKSYESQTGGMGTMGVARKSGLTGLALLLDKLGSLLTFIGDKVKATDNFSDYRRSEFDRPQDFQRSSEFNRPQDFQRSSEFSRPSEFSRSSEFESRPIQQGVSSYSYVPPRDVSSGISSSSVSSGISSSGLSTSGMGTSDVSSGVRSSDNLGHVVPPSESQTTAITTQTTATTAPTWAAREKLSEKSKLEQTKENLDVLHKAEGQRPILGGK